MKGGGRVYFLDQGHPLCRGGGLLMGLLRSPLVVEQEGECRGRRGWVYLYVMDLVPPRDNEGRGKIYRVMP